jgi:hypothetical protein
MINWNKIKTGSGNATHVPEAINNLFSIDDKIRENAYWKLDNYVVVQSDLFEAAFYIIEPIVALLENPYHANRLFALRILVEVAVGGNGDEILPIVYNGNTIHIRLDEACKKKFSELKSRLKKIIVKTDEEKEELELLLENID